MKFNKYFKEKQIDLFKDKYVDYKMLKHTIKIGGEFKTLYYQELTRINNVISIIKQGEITHNIEEIRDFLVLNYMALFKAIKKYDKKFQKFQKRKFFLQLQSSEFYSYYMTLPRAIHTITKLVIFDKDGTLVDQNAIFSPWLESLVISLCDKVGCTMINEMFEFMGYNETTKQFTSNSVVAKGTNNDIINALVKFCVKHNIVKSGSMIRKIIEDNWELPKLQNGNGESSIIPCGNITKLFEYLKSNTIKVAICTNDDRTCTEKTIEYLNIKHLVDYIVCGDDPISSKPSPEPIWTVCQNLCIDINHTIMVGDTITDIHAGRNAGCSMVVGVLSGNYSDFNLKHADVVIPNIDDIYPLIKI